MAALGAGSLPFLRADERPAAPVWLAQEDAWLLHPGGPGALRAYASLCGALAGLHLLPGARRDGADLRLALGRGPLRFVLEGVVRAEFLSSERGEAQRHLHADFDLPGGWTLHWRLLAGQDLLTGAVRLRSATGVGPGPRRSFRHLIAARALRRALARRLESHPTFLGGNHGQAEAGS